MRTIFVLAALVILACIGLAQCAAVDNGGTPDGYAAELLAVDAGGAHSGDAARQVRQFGFGRGGYGHGGFGRGGFGRGGFGGFGYPRYGGYYG